MISPQAHSPDFDVDRQGGTINMDTLQSMEWTADISPWERPQVDLFDGIRNHCKERYISFCPDSNYVGINALKCQ